MSNRGYERSESSTVGVPSGNQVALESIYRRSLPIKAGQASDVLRDQIKEFQTDYGLANDGKVGTQTMQKMMDVLSGLIPRPYSEWRPEHSTESVLRDDEAEERPGPGPLLTEGAAVTDTGVFGADDRVAQSNTIKEPNRWVCLINTASDIMTLKYEPTGIEQVRAGFTWSLGGKWPADQPAAHSHGGPRGAATRGPR
jgi:hypothetical protein